MITKVVTTVSLLLGSIAPVEAGMWDSFMTMCGLQEQSKAPTVKVLVGKELDGALLEVKGKYNIYDPFKGEKLGSRFFGKSNYIQPVVEGIKWGEVFPGVFQIAIIPDDLKTTTVVNGIEYRGSLYVYQIENTINIVNEVAVEDYVHSIMAVQFDAPVSQEVMAAMAIALRTDACYAAASNPEAFWHVDASNVGYAGYAVTRRNSALEEVMSSTKFLVLSSTRAYEGQVTPLKTCCLEKEYGQEGGSSGWSVAKAQALAGKGDNAAKILGHLYPAGSVEMLTSLDQAVGVKSVIAHEQVKGKEELGDESTLR